MRRTEPKVQVFVASFNTRSATELTIRSLVRRAAYPFDLVVGDSASRDGSREMLQRFADEGVLTLDWSDERRSQGSWLDQWYGSTDQRFIVFSDSDVYYARDGWLRDMMEVCETSGAALVAASFQADWTERPKYADGKPRALPAGRAEPYLLLLDMDQLRGVVDTSFEWHEEPLSGDPTRKLEFDGAANFYRSFKAAGLQAAQMPAEFRSKHRHWGSLSWKKRGEHDLGLKVRLKQAAKIAMVHTRLVQERVLDHDLRRRYRVRPAR